MGRFRWVGLFIILIYILFVESSLLLRCMMRLLPTST